jgi:hypothetical protein
MLDREWSTRKSVFEAWLAPVNFDCKGGQRRSLAEVAAAQGYPDRGSTT